jgi:hypothetical protein
MNSDPLAASSQPHKGKPVRRLVTGEDADGRSYFVFDGHAPNETERGPLWGSVIWATGGSAAPGPDPAPAGHRFGFHSPMGTVFRIADFPPDSRTDPTRVAEFIAENRVHASGPPDPKRHFLFHKTESLDYAICLQGEIYAMLDKEERLLQQGDVLVQRATNHSWSNRSGNVCRMAFVLIDLDIEGTRLP